MSTNPLAGLTEADIAGQYLQDGWKVVPGSLRVVESGNALEVQEWPQRDLQRPLPRRPTPHFHSPTEPRRLRFLPALLPGSDIVCV